jgi:hypothetical protein
LEKCQDDLSERSAATPGHLNAAAAREYRDHIYTPWEFIIDKHRETR